MRFSTIIFLSMFCIFACKSTEKQTTERSPRGEKPEIGELFTKMDINSDGKLSEMEAQGHLFKNFSKIDQNKDGFINKEEISAAEKLRGNRPARGSRSRS